MVKQVLAHAGFVEGETFKETRFLKPPKTTYAVFLDSFTSRGADSLNLIKDHEFTIELYSYSPDALSEIKIEDALDYFGLSYVKESRTWLQDEQLYQVIYYFNYIEK